MSYEHWDDPFDPAIPQPGSTSTSQVTELFNDYDDNDLSRAPSSRTASVTNPSTVPAEVNAPARDFLDPMLAHELQPEPSPVTLSSHPWSQATVDLLGQSSTGTHTSSQARSARISTPEPSTLMPLIQQMLQSQNMTNNLLQTLVQSQLLQQRQQPHPLQQQHYHYPPSNSPVSNHQQTSNSAPASVVSQSPRRPRRRNPPIPNFLNDTGLSYDPTSAPADDEASTSSTISAISQALRDGLSKQLQSSKITVPKISLADLQDITKVTQWETQVYAELSANRFYESIYSNNTLKVAGTDAEADSKLFSVLQGSLDAPLCAILSAAEITTGSGILSFISSRSKKITSSASSQATVKQEFFSIKWTPATESLELFNTRFLSLLGRTKSLGVPLDIVEIRSVWISALPSQFAMLKENLNKQKLDTNWTESCASAGDLYFCTKLEMDHSNIAIDSTDKTNRDQKKAMTIRNLDRVKASDRAEYPEDYNSYNSLKAEMKKRKDDGKTKDEVINFFKATYPFRSCILCRIPRKGHDLYHETDNCLILNKLFQYSSTSICRAANSQSSSSVRPTAPPSTLRAAATKPFSVPSTNTIACYDSGTWPKHLCSDISFFRDIVYFDKPKFVEYAEETCVGKVLGQGIIDVIIDNRIRIQASAYLTEGTQFLIAASDHLSYTDNKLIGQHGSLHVSFGNHTFSTHACDKFEFPVSPGKDSSLPIHWKPNEQKLVTNIAHNEVKIVRLSSDAQLPSKATRYSTGFDISSSDMVQLDPYKTAKIPLGFAMEFPEHLQCELRPRSSLSLKGIHLSLGTIDSDYRGEVCAIMSNTTATPVTINIGQRIGQLVFSPVVYPTVTEISNIDSLSSTSRGKGGFGSTDVKSNKRALQTLPTIQEAPIIQMKPSISDECTDINSISNNALDVLIDSYVRHEVHEISSADPPKKPFKDAISLLDTELYNQAKFNILGNSHDFYLQPKKRLRNLKKPQQVFFTDFTSKPLVSDPILLLTNSPSPPPDNKSVQSEDEDDYISPLISPTEIFPEHDFYAELDDEQDDSIDFEALVKSSSPTFVQSVLQESSHPRITPADRVSSTEPKTKVMTTEYLQKCVGFRNIQPILNNLKSVAADTVSIQDTGRNPLLSRGETATLPKKKSNKSSVPRPATFGTIWHYDIVYGNGTAIGGIKYGLFFVDRHSRYKILIGVKNLSAPSLQSAMKKFIRKVGFFPSELIADRDFRLIGESIDTILAPHTQVSGAPGGRQSQNGLSEANWKYVCNIARGYLAEHLLPPKFWFFALQYAVQVANYLPLKASNGTVTTSFFQAFNKRPDYRKLKPLFASSYVKVYESAEENNLKTQTVPCILVGNDEKSDGTLFYNPKTNSILASSDFIISSGSPSGPLFQLDYDEPTEYTLFDEDTKEVKIEYNVGDLVYISPSCDEHQGKSASVLLVPLSLDEPYTVQIRDTGDIKQIHPSHILSYDPQQATAQDCRSFQYTWLQHHAKCTYFDKSTMSAPKQGFLLRDNETSTWKFHQGRSLSQKSSRNNPAKALEIADSIFSLEELVHNGMIHKGWVHSKTILSSLEAKETLRVIARRVAFCNSTNADDISTEAVRSTLKNTSPPEVIAYSNRVSAKSLSSLYEPKLHEHANLPPSDKDIWDKSYLEEYMGLHEDTETWTYITEQEYQILRKSVGNALPSMAISKIKKDANGNPERAKYRIVVLGNLDPHDWSDRDCFAPVLSPLELRLLVAIATQNRVVPKQGDVSQAFVQSTLPENEKYVIRPPHGCPITPPDTYLLLKKTLYGLKRSPRHWYETCTKALKAIGLQPLPNAPCIFVGTLIQGQPPLYLGLYVDDFIFFSSSPEVEKEFQTKFGAMFKTDFQQAISHFLGVKFTINKHDDGNLDVYLSQTKEILELIAKMGLDKPHSLTAPTPYRSGLPVDSVPHVDMDATKRLKLNKLLQEVNGSLNWLANMTRPDIATITNILSQYNTNCSPGHIAAAKHVVRYLKGTTNHGIKFSSTEDSNITSFVKFPIDPSQIQALTDSNWGPQDQSVPKPNDPPILLDLFKTRSIAGHVILLGGPVHWQAKRQSFTARSSSDAEIGAVDECTKVIMQIRNILKDMNLFKQYTNGRIIIHNDNSAAVNWSHNMTTKGLRYLQIRENAVREEIEAGLITVKHIPGKDNVSDMFTKEDKDPAHFIACRDTLLHSIPPTGFSQSSRAQALEGGC